MNSPDKVKLILEYRRGWDDGYEVAKAMQGRDAKEEAPPCECGSGEPCGVCGIIGASGSPLRLL